MKIDEKPMKIHVLVCDACSAFVRVQRSQQQQKNVAKGDWMLPEIQGRELPSMEWRASSTGEKNVVYFAVAVNLLLFAALCAPCSACPFVRFRCQQIIVQNLPYISQRVTNHVVSNNISINRKANPDGFQHCDKK